MEGYPYESKYPLSAAIAYVLMLYVLYVIEDAPAVVTLP
jgi:hypothetical protein